MRYSTQRRVSMVGVGDPNTKKVSTPRLYHGIRGIPYFCVPLWSVKKCAPVAPMPAWDCLPSKTKTSTVPYRYNAIDQDKRQRLRVNVLKDVQCKGMAMPQVDQ